MDDDEKENTSKFSFKSFFVMNKLILGVGWIEIMSFRFFYLLNKFYGRHNFAVEKNELCSKNVQQGYV